MYVRGGIAPGHVLRDTWRLVVVAALWALAIIALHEHAGLRTITVPMAPVTTIGIVVSLYLGFKTTSAYQRWWEARQVWGGIINESRMLAVYALTFISPQDGGEAAQRRIIHRQIAWTNALAYVLRQRSRLPVSPAQHLFARRHGGTAVLRTADPQCYRRHLSEPEVAQVEAADTLPLQILRLQGEELRTLLDDGRIDDNRFVSISGVLRQLNVYQGQCERLKNTPFPRQITVFGRVFTYIFIALVPLALIQPFEDTVARHPSMAGVLDEYLLLMLPFSVLISWVFYVLEKVSESCEDPFEWGATDVPLTELTRVVEADLLDLLGEDGKPPRQTPLAGALY